MATGASPADASSAALPFAFRGGLWAYWRIHIVGLLLSIATLGLYSPWAKLRRVRYLYGNTNVMGSHLEFDARPLSILVSRLIVVTVLILASFADDAYPSFLAEVLGFGTVVLAVLFPLALMRGRAFHARHTLFKGVRFRYVCRYGPMAANIALMYAPIIAILIIGLNSIEYFADAAEQLPGSPEDLEQVAADGEYEFLSKLAPGSEWLPALALYLAVAWPALKRWQHDLLLSHLSFGKLKLRLTAGSGAYYRAYAICALTVAPPLAISYLPIDGLDIVLALLQLSAILLFFPMYSLLVRKLFWSNIELSDGSRIASRITLRGLWAVYMANGLTIVLSLGMLWPMATARNWRYVASHTALVPGSMLGTVATDQGEAVSAIGEEGVDLVGFDFDAGVI